MLISFVRMVDRLPAVPARPHVARLAAIGDGIIGGTDHRSIAQRVALTAFTVRIVSAVIAYVSQVLIARWIGDYEYGIFAVVWVGAVILGGLSCLGFQKAIVRFVPEHEERGETALLRGVLFGSRLQALLTALLVAVLGGLGLYLFGDQIGGHYLMPLFLAAVCLPMLAVSEVQEGIARSYNWSDLSFWPPFIYRPLLILLFMWGAVLLGWPANAVTAMGAVIAATFCATAFQLAILQRRLRSTVPPGPRAYQGGAWLAVTLPFFLVEGFYALSTNIDVLMVGYFLAPDRVAVYFAASKTLALVQFVYYAVRAGSAHRFSQYHTAGDRHRFDALVRDTLHWTFWPSLAMAGVLIVLGRPLLSLFGPSFADGYPLLFIIIAGLICRASIGPAESLLLMSGHQRACAIVYFASFILNVVLNITLIPRFGLTGAASATALALAAESLVLYFVTRSLLGIRCWIPFAFGASGRIGTVSP